MVDLEREISKYLNKGSGNCPGPFYLISPFGCEEYFPYFEGVGMLLNNSFLQGCRLYQLLVRCSTGAKKD